MTAATRPHALIVAYSFPPYAAIGTMRTLRLVRQLDARGWRVTVLTGDPKQYFPHTAVDDALLDKVPGNVRVIRAGAWHGFYKGVDLLVNIARATKGGTTLPEGAPPKAPSPGRAGAPPRRGLAARLAAARDFVDGVLSIPDNESGWLVPAFASGTLDQIRHARADIIYSSAPPWTGQVVAYGLKAALRKPWVADFRDPWARAPWREDRPWLATHAAAFLEQRVVRRADHILFAAKANREEYARHYGTQLASKFHFITNGCDPTEFEPLTRNRAPSDGTFVLLHAGSLYAGRTPVSLLNATATAIKRGLIDPNRFKLRFLGWVGLKGTDLQATIQSLGLEHIVEFVPPVPRATSLAAMAAASGLLLLQPGHMVSVPGKLFEYLAIGRPILAVAEEGEIAEIVRASGIGVAVRPDDEEGLVGAIGRIVMMASAAVPRPSLDLFDGNASAARAADILAAIVRGEAVPRQPFSVGSSAGPSMGVSS